MPRRRRVEQLLGRPPLDTNRCCQKSSRCARLFRSEIRRWRFHAESSQGNECRPHTEAHFTGVVYNVTVEPDEVEKIVTKCVSCVRVRLDYAVRRHRHRNASRGHGALVLVNGQLLSRRIHSSLSMSCSVDVHIVFSGVTVHDSLEKVEWTRGKELLCLLGKWVKI
ncbi:unnamed protein product [Lampetra planeri]